MKRLTRLFSHVLAVLFLSVALFSCDYDARKISRAERAFDSKNFDKAQFAYFEAISTLEGEMREEALESLTVRLEPIVKSKSFDPAKYSEWAALLDVSPVHRDRVDRAFAEGLVPRAESELEAGNLKEAAILAGYIPDEQDDGSVSVRIREAQAGREEALFSSGLVLYKEDKFDEAIEAWVGLDPASEWGVKAGVLKEGITEKKRSFLLSEAKKRPVDGFKIIKSGPVKRIIFNRIKGKDFEIETAMEGRQFLRLEATIDRDIDLYAWYPDGDGFAPISSLRRELLKLDFDDVEDIKRIYKRGIPKGRSVDVVYYISVEYDFHKTHDVYISTEMIPRKLDDLSEIAIVKVF